MVNFAITPDVVSREFVRILYKYKLVDSYDIAQVKVYISDNDMIFEFDNELFAATNVDLFISLDDFSDSIVQKAAEYFVDAKYPKELALAMHLLRSLGENWSDVGYRDRFTMRMLANCAIGHFNRT